MFHHQIKHLEGRQKNAAAGRILNSLLGVASADEKLRLMFDILGRFLRAGGRGFPPTTFICIIPGYFHRKIKENGTKRTSEPFKLPPKRQLHVWLNVDIR